MEEKPDMERHEQVRGSNVFSFCLVVFDSAHHLAKFSPFQRLKRGATENIRCSPLLPSRLIPTSSPSELKRQLLFSQGRSRVADYL